MPIPNFGAILRFHRRKSGLSQAALANLAGLGKTVVFDIEKGKIDVKVSTLLKLFEVMNISIILKSPLMDLYHAQDKGKDHASS